MGNDAVSGMEGGASERGSTDPANLQRLTGEAGAGTERQPEGIGLASNGWPVAVHRCDRFVARTMNWLYDHLAAAPRYHHLIATDKLENRLEFPALRPSRWRRGPGVATSGDL